LLALILFAQSCAGDAIAPCSCSPIVYKWKLNLNSICPDTIPTNEGVGINSSCGFIPPSDADQQPIVKVTALRFLEFGAELGDIVNFQLIMGEWFDGDQMEIESITKNETDVYTTAASFELDGMTEEGETITMQWIVDYTNYCGVNPDVNITDIAWMEFVSFYNLNFLQTFCIP